MASVREGQHSREPANKPLLHSALRLLSGADDPLPGDPDKPEFPGLFSFMRRNWKSETKSGREGFFRKYGRLSREFKAAKVREAAKLRTYEAVARSAALSKEFLSLLFASCIIATIGLFQGSTAVIIGAMLIAPLMMPILGFALATIWGDRRLLWRSVGTLVIGSVMVLAVAVLVTTLVPGVELNSEIQARINPNLYDILVALASGLIGAYAFANPRISPSIAGVAIAVALMPPLCTVGIGLGLGSSRVAGGALLLYVSNLLGVSLAASFVFWRLRIHPIGESEVAVGTRARRNVVLTAALLIVVAVPLGYFMSRSYAVKKLDAQVRAALEERLAGVEILSLSVHRFSGGHEVRSVVIVPPETPASAIAGAREAIAKLAPERASVRLHVVRSDRDEPAVPAFTDDPPPSLAAAPDPPAEARPTARKKKRARKRRQRRSRRSD